MSDLNRRGFMRMVGLGFGGAAIAGLTGCGTAILRGFPEEETNLLHAERRNSRANVARLNAQLNRFKNATKRYNAKRRARGRSKQFSRFATLAEDEANDLQEMADSSLAIFDELNDANVIADWESDFLASTPNEIQSTEPSTDFENQLVDLGFDAEDAVAVNTTVPTEEQVNEVQNEVENTGLYSYLTSHTVDGGGQTTTGEASLGSRIISEQFNGCDYGFALCITALVITGFICWEGWAFRAQACKPLFRTLTICGGGAFAGSGLIVEGCLA